MKQKIGRKKVDTGERIADAWQLRLEVLIVQVYGKSYQLTPEAHDFIELRIRRLSAVRSLVQPVFDTI